MSMLRGLTKFAHGTGVVGRAPCYLVPNLTAARLTKQFAVPSRHYKPNPTIKGYWPEPITQQTLDEFLRDINYFEEPKELINIGVASKEEHNDETTDKKETSSRSNSSLPPTTDHQTADVDELLKVLSQDVNPLELDHDDTNIDNKQLVQLAISAGIFRDLFGQYDPNRDHIKFTPQQAKNLDRIVPTYWITDQPYARVERNPKQQGPLYYFDPIVGISARFVNSVPQANNDDCDEYAHTSYHGNIIPAKEALVKPSITLNANQLPKNSPNFKKDSAFNNWKPGSITLANANQAPTAYHTVLLVNLDHLHHNSANLHWMAANIKLTENGTTKYDELCEYLPVHGIRGFGYSRYVFLALQHDSELNVKFNNFSLNERKFNCKHFLEQNKSINMLPIGLSWFQTTWDESSNKIFHDYLNMKAPAYELIQQQYEERQGLDKNYPGKIPFNVFLDYGRDPKEINEQVLTERLKSVDPFNYKDQYVPPKVPPTIFEDEGIPDWMRNVMFKKKNKVGYWRGLRPASVTLPLNNNADLDYPLRPLASSQKSPPGFHNLYSRPKKKMLKDLPDYNKQANEVSNVFIEADHEIHMDKVREMMKEFETKVKK